MNFSDQSPLALPIKQPTIWQKLLWRASALGRVHLALANSYTDRTLNLAFADLQKKLAQLQTSQFSSYPEAKELRSLTLARLTELALQLTDLSQAATYLAQLEETAIVTKIHLTLHWRLIQALVIASQPEAAFAQTKRYIAYDESPTSHVAECLSWVLTDTNLAMAQAAAEAVALPHQSDKRIFTLRRLCLSDESPSHPDEAQEWIQQTQPSLLSDKPLLQGQAHLLRVKWAEIVGDWAAMLVEAKAALKLLPNRDEARYWMARALLHQHPRLPAQAATMLIDPPQAMNLTWQRLAIIATLLEQPDLAQAAACLPVVEGQFGQLTDVELKLAMVGFELALRTAVDDSPERLETITHLDSRLATQVGSLTWADYNLAVKEICTTNLFEQADTRLAALTNSPPDSCPIYLLRAVCVTQLERWDDLANLLATANPPPSPFIPDAQFFQTLLDTFAYWRGEPNPTQAIDLFAQLNQPPGRLIQAIPTLKTIHSLLHYFFAGVTAQEETRGQLPDTPPQAAWVQWLWWRLWLQHSISLEIEDRLANYAPHFALTWEHIGWLQEFSAVISPTVMPVLHIALADLKQTSQPLNSRWQELVTQRQYLLEMTIENWPDSKTQPNSLWGNCPWWPAAGLWQKLAQYEAQIEHYYLKGRLELRQKSPAKALTWFNAAQTLLRQPKATEPLTAVRFLPVLLYWHGVALAHLQRFDEATAQLHSCLASSKRVEAMAQLGLIAVAQNNIEDAAIWLEQIPQPWPPSAAYLAALIAERREDYAEATTALNYIFNTDQTYSSIYTVAAYRLRGLLEERSGNASAALVIYRQALSYWPLDAVVAARLARLWLQNSYPPENRQQPITFESALADKWESLTQVEWAAQLPLMFNCLQALADSEPLPEALSDNLEVIVSSGNAAWVQFLLRIFLATGDVERAKSLADTMRLQSKLFSAISTLLPGREMLVAYCQGNGNGKLHAPVRQLALEIAELRTALPGNQFINFWHDLILAVLEPPRLESGGLFWELLEDGIRPFPHQLTASLLTLFSKSEAHRQQAANLCLRLADNEKIITPQQTLEAKCLAAYISGDRKAFLSHYQILEQNWPSSLLCDEAALYVAACQARLQNNEFQAITYGFIPTSLADLSQPHVRQVIGLAFAHGAAKHAQNNVRQALHELEQATQLLGLTEIG